MTGTVAGVDAAPTTSLRPSLTTPAVIVVVALVVDQLSKWWALDELEDGSVIEVLPTLEFDLHYNTGFSFGTGTGMGRWIAILVVVLC
ncbi:MAG: signal peptidase II, partial [Acidimicrobiales bacterium]